MLRRPTSKPAPSDPGDRPSEGSSEGAVETEGPVRDLPDLSSLGIAGLTRRRSAGIIGVVVAAWIIVVFARQVGEASAATARAEQMARDNIALAAEVDGLAEELELIQRQPYIEQQARAYQLGGRREIAFALDRGAPTLAPDAPGSASVRLGSDQHPVGPFERWMTLLFGPAD